IEVDLVARDSPVVCLRCKEKVPGRRALFNPRRIRRRRRRVDAAWPHAVRRNARDLKRAREPPNSGTPKIVQSNHAVLELPPNAPSTKNRDYQLLILGLSREWQSTSTAHKTNTDTETRLTVQQFPHAPTNWETGNAGHVKYAPTA